jgi:ABC-type transport system involved in cytochrome c biogenesis permease component
LAADGMHVIVVLVLLVLKTVEVTGIYEVTAFFALTVTVGPAGIVVYKMDVVVDAFGVLVLILVVRVVVVWVTTTEGEGAVNCCKNVEVLLSVVVLPFSVEVEVEI